MSDATTAAGAAPTPSGGLSAVVDSRPAFEARRPLGLLATMAEDLRTVVARDPSVSGPAEALLHPALLALWGHRVAHVVHRGGYRITARLVMTVIRAVTSVEIHPGAVLGRRVFIDHGAAVVIGETAEVGDDVTLYHQVTLGAVGWWQDNERPEGERRHPVVGAGAVLGANASVIGPVTIGAGAVVGAQALVVDDVPAGARALAPAVVVTARRSGDRDRQAVRLTENASAGCW